MITIQLKDAGMHFEGVFKDRREKALEALRRTVQIRGPMWFQLMVDQTTPHKPVDRGTYRRQIHTGDIPNGAALFNSAPYASIIEEGRRPGTMPPLAPIEAWVRRKFGTVLREYRSEARGVMKGQRWMKGYLKTFEEQAVRQTALAIARKIKARGIPGKHVMQRTADKLRPEVVKAVQIAAFGVDR